MTPTNTSLGNFESPACTLRYTQKWTLPRTTYLLWAFLAVFFLSLGAGLGSARADSLDTWQWRNPLPEGNTLSYVAFGDNTFVALGSVGTILASPDGITWSSTNTAPSTTFTSLGYLNNLFLATANNGTILTSSNGLDWTAQDSGISRDLFGATYGNGLYVAVGAYGTILTSPDGVNWSGRNVPTGYDLNGVAFGNGIFVATGAFGTVLTSTDGATWTPSKPPTNEPLTYVAYGAGNFLALGATTGTVYTSADGMTWGSIGNVGPNPLGLTFENNLFIVISANNQALISGNGASWSNVSPGLVDGVAYGNGTYVAVGTETDATSGNQYGGIWTSPNATTWTARNSAITYQNLDAMGYGDDTFVMVGKKGTIISSLDCEYFETRNSNTESDLNSIAFGNGESVVVGDQVIVSSSDEVTWSPATWNPPLNVLGSVFNGVTFGNGEFVTVGGGYNNATANYTLVSEKSTDGINWTAAPFGIISGTAAYATAVAYGNNTFVAVGPGFAYTSSDGSNWTRNNPGAGLNLTGVAYSNGVFVAVGTGGTILNSTNGTSWTADTSGITFNLNSVTVGNGIFVAAGNDGALLSSTDGVNWAVRNTGIANPPQLNGIGYGWGTFVSVGNSGTILQSAALEGVGPVVTTGTATGITFSSATLTGTVSSNGPASVANFEYATNPQFMGAAYTANIPIASGSTPVPLSATVQYLLPNQTYYFRLQAYNVDALQSGSTVAFNTPPAPPVITSSTSATGFEGSPFAYQITALNSPASFNASSLPTGLNVNTSTGLISGTVNTTGTFAATIYATNSAATSSTTLTITILLPAAPVITSATNALAQIGVPFSYQITATNGPFAYNATSLPPGLGVNPSTGLVSGTPSATGTFPTTISAISTGGTGSALLSIKVVNPPPPVVTSNLTASGVEGSAFSYQITASNSPSSFGATGSLDGLSVNTSTGLISGTPTIAGVFNSTISAANASGTGTATLTLIIQEAPPVITSNAAITGTEGAPFSFQITATYSPTGFTATGLPTGLTVNTDSGLISGVPGVSGTFTVDISASNGAGTTVSTISLVVVLPPAPVITSAASATGTDGVVFNYLIVATNYPTGYGATGLPAGLSYNSSTGLIFGTPTASGTFPVTLSAVNSGGTGTALFNVVILPKPPVISSSLSATGTTGFGFNYQIAASNSPAGYGATGLPPGLAVNSSSGLISGTPTTSGTFGVVLSAANVGGTGSATLSLTVDVNFPTVKGSYVGLAATGGTNAGLVTISISANGQFTGKITLAGGSYPLKGKFSQYGVYVGTVSAFPVALDDTLNIDPSTPAVGGTIVVYSGGNITHYTFESTLLWSTKVAPLPGGIAGTYTALLPAVTGTDSTLPATPGYSTIKITSAGAIAVVGKLGDGTAFKASSHLKADGKTWELFSLLYPAKYHGTIAGTMTLETLANSDCDGVASWVKPAQATGSYYTGGFSTTINVIAAKYAAPALASGTASVSLTGGNLTDPGITDSLSISSNGKVTVTGANTGTVTLSLTPTTGAFSGQFLYPGTNKKTPFGGVIYQKPASAGFGLFLGTDQSGSVDITP